MYEHLLGFLHFPFIYPFLLQCCYFTCREIQCCFEPFFVGRWLAHSFDWMGKKRRWNERPGGILYAWLFFQTNRWHQVPNNLHYCTKWKVELGRAGRHTSDLVFIFWIAVAAAYFFRWPHMFGPVYKICLPVHHRRPFILLSSRTYWKLFFDRSI